MIATSRSRAAIVVLAAVAVFSGVVVEAAEPRMEVRVTPRFGVDDTASLEVKIVDGPSGVAAPDLGEMNNLEVVGGPSRGTEFSFINGVTTSAVTFNYVVRALDVGPASVGPVTIEAGDEVLRAEAISIDIVPGSVVPPRRGRRRSPFSTNPFEDFFPRQRSPAVQIVLRHLLSSSKVVEGESVMATVVLDATGRVNDFDWLAAPSYPGWWAQRVEPPEQITPEVVEVDGVRFNRFTIACHALVPLKAGVLKVPPVRARIGVGTRSLLDPGDLMERSADEIEVQVAQRPPAPEGFVGAVGQLRYAVELDPEEIEFGASAVLTARLEGTGNLPLVESPTDWPSCEECETYPPEEESKIGVDQRGIHGSRSWRVTVVPRRWGELTLDQVEFAVFDPRSDIYRRQVLGPFALNVLPPPPTPTPTVSVAEVGPVDAGQGQVDVASEDAGDLPQWIWVALALVVGVTAGGWAVWAAGRRRLGVIPPRRPDQTPAERARELQVALERWWLDASARKPNPGVEVEMESLRRALEAVRFAPGRADHTETIVDLEERFRRLLRDA